MIQRSCAIEGLDKFYAIFHTAKQMNKLQRVTTWSNFPNIMFKKKTEEKKTLPNNSPKGRTILHSYHLSCSLCLPKDNFYKTKL